MLRYGFFDSEITGFDDEGMPIFDRAESSDFLAMFLSKIISDGVLAAPADCFQVVAGEGMALKVRPGFGIIRGRFAMDTQEYEITIPTAPTAYKRYDRVILRANYLQRCCEIIVRSGEANANPVLPELLQPASGDYYELCLATIAIKSNQSAITQSNITDTRYDSSVCGVVTQVIDHLDTSVFYAQLDQFYKEFIARSDESYDQFISDMDAYLAQLDDTGSNQLAEIVKTLTDFENTSEAQFMEWFQKMKDQLTEDAAGQLLELIGECESALQAHMGDSGMHVTAEEKESWKGKMETDGDSAENTVTFSSGDAADPTGWADVEVMASGEKHSSLLRKISLGMKNNRWLKKLVDNLNVLVGNTDISGLGGGTITGALKALNTDLGKKSTVSVTRNLTSGTKVSTITINGQAYDLYAPTDTNTWRGIQDNLTSTSTTDSLSANQGRILNNKLNVETLVNSDGVLLKKSGHQYDLKFANASLSAIDIGRPSAFRFGGHLPVIVRIGDAYYNGAILLASTASAVYYKTYGAPPTNVPTNATFFGQVSLII